MMKLVYNLETYYLFFCNTQCLLRDTSVREIAFSDHIIDDKKENILNRVFNIAGNNLLDLRLRLEHFKNQINSNRVTIKRAGINLPRKYDTMEKIALEKINATIQDLETKVSQTEESKRKLRDEMRRRHGLISKWTLKSILREITWIRPLVKD